MTREEAIKNIKLFFTGINIALSNKTKEALDVLIPELAESEDERIRKALVWHLKADDVDFVSNGVTKRECIAYLEKQKEKEIPKWMPKFLDELRSKKHYFDWDEHRDIEGSILAIIDFIAPDYFTEKDKKEQKPILEVFGFKVGDAVRLKDGDGRKHIIKSFEEVEGVHGPNFYHVEFEDNSARDGIYPGEEYPNGYYTQMEKIEEEQKPAECIKIGELAEHIKAEFESFRNLLKKKGIDYQPAEAYWTDFARLFVSTAKKLQKPAEWSEEDKRNRDRALFYVSDYQKNNGVTDGSKECVDWLKSLRPSWKPSEGQMESLRTAMDRDDGIGYHLGQLYEQLKKLM